jgi:hypothetical protein
VQEGRRDGGGRAATHASVEVGTRQQQAIINQSHSSPPTSYNALVKQDLSLSLSLSLSVPLFFPRARNATMILDLLLLLQLYCCDGCGGSFLRPTRSRDSIARTRISRSSNILRARHKTYIGLSSQDSPSLSLSLSRSVCADDGFRASMFSRFSTDN